MYLVIGLVTGLVCLFGFVLLVVCLLVFAIACLFDVRIVLCVVLLFVGIATVCRFVCGCRLLGFLILLFYSWVARFWFCGFDVWW